MKSIPYYTGLLIFILGVVTIVQHDFVNEWVYQFIVSSGGPDGEITPHGREILSRSIYLLGTGLILCALVILYINNSSRRESLISAFIKDSGLSSVSRKDNSLLVLIISTAVGIILTYLYLHNEQLSIKDLYKEDSFFESGTALLFLIASVFMFISFQSLRAQYKGNVLPKIEFIIIFIYAIIAVGFFLIGMEEISWGQRIFNWDTPTTLDTVNIQHETNVHNIFNPYFDLAYQVAAICILGVFVISILLKTSGKENRFSSLILPHPNLLGLAILITLYCFPPFGRKGELVEELAAVLVLFYSYRNWLCVKSGRDKTQALKQQSLSR